MRTVILRVLSLRYPWKNTYRAIMLPFKQINLKLMPENQLWEQSVENCKRVDNGQNNGCGCDYSREIVWKEKKSGLKTCCWGQEEESPHGRCFLPHGGSSSSLASFLFLSSKSFLHQIYAFQRRNEHFQYFNILATFILLFECQLIFREHRILFCV